ncbi:uncharacterized protein LOC108134902 [Drosophila elegans]|uniref:uncharacterized protein LOC108134902 n=1 Tax=Drosophila elegans TaxID=30023 RepID=UPI0007E5E55A|nr:uncharacterized protein LOC108134902 [Drosophila elegans]
MEIGNEQSYKDFFDKLRSDSGPRNLRQIFEDDDRPLETESPSLRYQPGSSKKPQGSKKSPITRSSTADKGDPPASTWNTVIAKVVHAYQGNENVGRVGCALSILGEMEASKLIVYKSKNQVLTTLQLTPRGGKVILRESYLQFYDDEQRFWSLRFDKEPDEREFVRLMMKNKLPMEHFISEVSSSSSGSPSCEDLSKSGEKSRSSRANPPQPQPRLRMGIPSPEKLEDETPEQEQDGTPADEDVIVTPLPRPIGSSNAQHRNTGSSSLAVATAGQTLPDNPLAVKALDKYMDEQRASGLMMEHKMDAILQAMNRMGKSGVAVPEAPSDPLLQRDREDEMLELEQKLLNLKRENRALTKNLKAREQALEDLRCSACALCEELLLQNADLKEQNEQLLASRVSRDLNSTAACHNCEQSSKQIAKMQRHIIALQEALRIYQKSGEPSSGRL